MFEEFAQRRQALLDVLGEDLAVVLPSAVEKVRNNDAHFPFRQSSDFYYLTGFEEPESLMVLSKQKGVITFTLFCRTKDPQKELWDGLRVGLDDAKALYGADQSYPIDEVGTVLPTLLDGKTTLFYPLAEDVTFDKTVLDAVRVLEQQKRAGKQPPLRLENVLPAIHEARLIKSPSEISLMQKAADISVNAHVRAMKAAKSTMHEYQLEAEILHEFMMHGARAAAYSSIVGSGKNACILHYVENNQLLGEHDLVLIDAGCEFGYYAADITRTFPVSGKFSEPQKAVYQIVLDAQLAAIDAVKPGASWNAAHEASVRVITEGLVNLGILEGKVSDLIESGAYTKYYMHRCGHWLGLDVHDAGQYKIDGQWRPLVPGMALTVEPGIYIAADDLSVDEKWRGIGIRIEDDVVVTATGCQVLTQQAPKTIEAIEALMA
ncbi:MAG: Xaa-Pro aminopeptidase [Cellvibrionales bacterium]|nr:Xaa-Pro aminopeptidase [Cellvibrionales bacterium]